MKQRERVSIDERLDKALVDVLAARDPEVRKAAMARYELLEEQAAREALLAHRATMAAVADHSGDAHR